MTQGKKEDRGVVFVVAIDFATGRFALVLDPAKPEPHYWKFPGGGIEEIDVDEDHPFDDRLTAENAARREAAEETGLGQNGRKRSGRWKHGRLVQLLWVADIKKRTHTQHVFLGLSNFDDLITQGEEGEIVQDFSEAQIRALPNFHPQHGAILNLALEKIRP